MSRMSTYIAPGLLAGLLLAPLSACSDSFFDVPDLNNPALETLESDPTPAGVVDATQGLLIGTRAGTSGQTGYVAHLGVLGRESFTFDPSDPRFVGEMVNGRLDPGNGAFGGSGWSPRYGNIRMANIILNALESVVGFSEAELEAIRGFTKTMQALDFLLLINMRYSNGIAMDVNRSLDEEPAPLVGRDAAFDQIVDLLNEADGHLQAAGDAFPFDLTSGFAGFDTPSTFRSFNRALLGRVQVYRQDYQGALAALDAAGTSTALPLDEGVFHVFGTASGDQANGLFQPTDPNIVAHPSIVTDAERKADGSLDDRVLAKTGPQDPPQSAGGLSSDLRFTHYPSLDSPLPIIRNEELILLRAEARWFSGDAAGALDDLNFIRQRSGGLEPIAAPASDDAFVTELLRQRRYSLLFEGGHRWIDHRRFDRLGDIPVDRSGDIIPEHFPIPTEECQARKEPVPCRASG